MKLNPYKDYTEDGAFSPVFFDNRTGQNSNQNDRPVSGGNKSRQNKNDGDDTEETNTESGTMR